MPITYTCVRYPTSKILFTKKNSFFIPQDVHGNNMTCANNCRGVNPNAVVIGGTAVLAAAAVTPLQVLDQESLWSLFIFIFMLFLGAHTTWVRSTCCCWRWSCLCQSENNQKMSTEQTMSGRPLSYFCQMLLKSEQEQLIKKKVLLPFDRLCLS